MVDRRPRPAPRSRLGRPLPPVPRHHPVDPLPVRADIGRRAAPEASLAPLRPRRCRAHSRPAADPPRRAGHARGGAGRHLRLRGVPGEHARRPHCQLLRHRPLPVVHGRDLAES